MRTLLMLVLALLAFALVSSAWAGCMTNLECGDDSFFCMRQAGSCEGEGSCSTKPEICTHIYSPVCGCDGHTYANECQAHAAGVTVSYEGECEPIMVQRAGIPCTAESDCADGEYCMRTACASTGTCAVRPELCPMSYSPVCGCDRNTYSNACRAAQRGTSIFRHGAC